MTIINNFDYSKEETRTWLDHAELFSGHGGNSREVFHINLWILKDGTDPKATTPRIMSAQTQGADKFPNLSTAETSSLSGDVSGYQGLHKQVFSCLEEGYMKSFQRYLSLENNHKIG